MHSSVSSERGSEMNQPLNTIVQPPPPANPGPFGDLVRREAQRQNKENKHQNLKKGLVAEEA